MNRFEWIKLADLPDEHIGPREEDVKFKVVAPMLRLLGFTDLDFSFETPADLGRIDITIKGFNAGVIVECKGPRVRLEDCISQVEKYVRETMTRQHIAMLSLLTNGKRFQVYGVTHAIYKNELTEHLLFEFSRTQLRDANIQTRLSGLLSRSVLEAGTVREAVTAALHDQQNQQQQRREEEEKTSALIAQKKALQEQIHALDAEMAGRTLIYSPTTSGVGQNSGVGQKFTESGKASFKWAKEYGSQETVCSWINDILEKLAPIGSTVFISRSQVTRELCAFLTSRGTERAQSLSKDERSKIAGNMIDWITAQWTTHLGGKDGFLMLSDPGAQVDSSEAPDWLRNFTRIWTRKSMGKYAFRRR